MLNGIFSLSKEEAILYLDNECKRLGGGTGRTRGTSQSNMPSSLALYGRHERCCADAWMACGEERCFYCLDYFTPSADAVQVGESYFPQVGVREGLFARCDIGASTVLEEYKGQVSEDSECDNEYALDVGDRIVIGTRPCKDINHSCDPNCSFQKATTRDGDATVYVVSLRDIYDGEEITCAYGTDRMSRFDCRCNACFAAL